MYQTGWMAALMISRKSQLAIKYAHQMRLQNQNLWVLWIHASNASRFDESLRDVANLVKLPGRSNAKADFLVLLQSWSRDTRKTWLVILDNVDDAAFLEATPTASDKVQSSKRRIDYFPSHDHGSLLITSRTKDEALKLVQDTEMIHVGVMNEAEAEELLERTLERSSPDNRTLARALDCIPLAISQAVAYIRRMGKHYSTGKYHE